MGQVIDVFATDILRIKEGQITLITEVCLEGSQDFYIVTPKGKVTVQCETLWDAMQELGF